MKSRKREKTPNFGGGKERVSSKKGSQGETSEKSMKERKRTKSERETYGKKAICFTQGGKSHSYGRV